MGLGRSSWLVASNLLGLGIKWTEWIELNLLFGVFIVVMSNMCFFALRLSFWGAIRPL